MTAVKSKIIAEAIKEYERAEITCLVAERKKSGAALKFLPLFSMIELVPSEQEDSTPIGSGTHPFSLRKSVDDDFTIHFIRIPALPVADMVNLYEQVQTAFSLTHGYIDIQAILPYTLVENPPHGQPLLIHPRREKTIGQLLPMRHTCCRVWSKINMNKDWLKELPKEAFEAIKEFSTEHIGMDISLAGEHLGNVYLVAPNPILRYWECSLLDLEKDLHISFQERIGKTVKGCQLVIEDQQSKNPGFFLLHTVTSNQERISLPCLPDELTIRLLDIDGNLIDMSFGTWTNFSFNLGIQHTVVNYSMQVHDELLLFSVPKKSYEPSVDINAFDKQAYHFLEDALGSRKYQELERTKEFVFFPKELNSTEKAKKIVREILNKAQKRCIILDPYFGSGDLSYVFHIENTSVPVRIISSYDFLGRKIQKINPSKKKYLLLEFAKRLWQYFFKESEAATYAMQLNHSLEECKRLFPQQTIECKVLLGNPSPLHDRYIVIDETVYLLGSSLNEFGNRTTTLIQVPTPGPMIEQAEKWWNTCEHISDVLQKKQNTN